MYLNSPYFLYTTSTQCDAQFVCFYSFLTKFPVFSANHFGFPLKMCNRCVVCATTMRCNAKLFLYLFSVKWIACKPNVKWWHFINWFFFTSEYLTTIVESGFYLTVFEQFFFCFNWLNVWINSIRMRKFEFKITFNKNLFWWRENIWNDQYANECWNLGQI